MTIAEIAWAAGLVEGEGWFRSHSGHNFILGISMTDLDVMERFARLVGGKITEKVLPAHTVAIRKRQWKVILCGQQAIGWMFTLYPFLGARRRARIREIVAEWKSIKPRAQHRTHCPSGHPYTPENVKYIRKPDRRNPVRLCRTCRASVERRKKRAA